VAKSKERYHDSPKVRELQILDRDEKVLELTLRGYTPANIARELGIDVALVNSSLKTWLHGYRTELSSLAEEIQLKEIARLDYLYQNVLPYALARKDEATGQIIPPDSRLLSVLVRLISEKREWVTAQRKEQLVLEARQSASETDGHTITHTFTYSSPLYQVALDNINYQWLQDADRKVDTLYVSMSDDEIRQEIDQRLGDEDE
jgi:hypothetical protein